MYAGREFQPGITDRKRQTARPGRGSHGDREGRRRVSRGHRGLCSCGLAMECRRSLLLCRSKVCLRSNTKRPVFVATNSRRRLAKCDEPAPVSGTPRWSSLIHFTLGCFTPAIPQCSHHRPTVCCSRRQRTGARATPQHVHFAAALLVSAITGRVQTTQSNYFSVAVGD